MDDSTAQNRKDEFSRFLTRELKTVNAVFTRRITSFLVSDITVHVQKIVSGASKKDAWRLPRPEGITLTQRPGLPVERFEAFMACSKCGEHDAQILTLKLRNATRNVRAGERRETYRIEQDAAGPTSPFSKRTSRDICLRAAHGVDSSFAAEDDRVPRFHVLTEKCMRFPVEEGETPSATLRSHRLTASGIVRSLVIRYRQGNDKARRAVPRLGKAPHHFDEKQVNVFVAAQS